MSALGVILRAQPAPAMFQVTTRMRCASLSDT
jgi:hypothetical protein